MTAYATIADMEARFRDQLILVAADEQTGERDDVRITAGLADATVEMRSILAARYSPADLDSLDEDAKAILRVYCIDIAFYRIALDFSRSTDNIKERYDQAIKRLEAIAAGKGALSTVNTGDGGTGSIDDVGEIGPNEAVVEAPERMFTRKRLGSI